VVAALPLLMSCGVDAVNSAATPRHTAAIVEMDLVSETFALGSSVTPIGAVPEDAASENFLRGGEVFLSVNVTGASTAQTVEVQWLAPDGSILRRDARVVAEGTKYVALSSGETKRWTPGAYRAVVVIDGRRVTEKAFGLL